MKLLSIALIALTLLGCATSQSDNNHPNSNVSSASPQQNAASTQDTTEPPPPPTSTPKHPEYVRYANRFILPWDANKVNAFDAGELMSFWTSHPGQLFYQLPNRILPVEGWMGFKGMVDQYKASISGMAIILEGRLEFAFVSSNAVIRYAPNGVGNVALIVDKSEFLLPNFDLRAATSQRGYYYRGPVVENNAPISPGGVAPQ